jgi:hypothetical protein
LLTRVTTSKSALLGFGRQSPSNAQMKSWCLLLCGIALAVVGAVTSKFSVVPYEPAVASGYPDAKTVAYRPWPILAIVIGVGLALFAVALLIRQKTKSLKSASLPPK